jgi:hypothetical protein
MTPQSGEQRFDSKGGLLYFAYLLSQRYLAMLDKVFSGYTLAIPDEVRIGYIELCNKIDATLAPLGVDVRWRVYESLLELSEESDLDWEYGVRSEVTKSLADIEDHWIGSGTPRPKLEQAEETFLNKIDSLLQSYAEYKKSADRMFERWAEKVAGKFNEPTTKKGEQNTSPLRRAIERIKPDELNVGIPGIAGAKYKFKKHAEEAD